MDNPFDGRPPAPPAGPVQALGQVVITMLPDGRVLTQHKLPEWKLGFLMCQLAALDIREQGLADAGRPKIAAAPPGLQVPRTG